MLIGITGGTGAGKTMLARKLAIILSSELTVSLVDLDSYYKDLSHLPPDDRERVNFDHPGALEIDRFQEDLLRLRRGEFIMKPAYDFVTHTRRPAMSVVAPGQLVIAEGLMLFAHEGVRSLFDVRVYVETPADVRLRRRVERDVRERGRTLLGAIQQYMESVQPMHEQFIEPAKDHAHVVISGSEHDEKAMAELVLTIRQNHWTLDLSRTATQG